LTKRTKAEQNFEYWRGRPNVETWADDLSFFGRNGCLNCRGIIALARDGDTVALQPITSKGEIGRCRIDVPVAALRALVDRLPKAAPAAPAPVVPKVPPTIEVIYRRMPCEPGQRRKPSDIMAVTPYESANKYKLATVAATFDSEYESACGWTGTEIDFGTYNRTKPVDIDDVPQALIDYVKWNPGDLGETDAPDYPVKIRRRINSNRYRKNNG
jgi:hypothetical protein